MKNRKYYEDVSDDGYHIPDQIRVTVLGESTVMRLRPVELPATGWVSLKDRKPTVEDADEQEQVVVRDTMHGYPRVVHYENVIHSKLATHWHPLAKFQEDKLPPFGEWFIQKLGWTGVIHLSADCLKSQIEAAHAEYAALQKEGV